jgi:hypothetical protein
MQLQREPLLRADISNLMRQNTELRAISRQSERDRRHDVAAWAKLEAKGERLEKANRRLKVEQQSNLEDLHGITVELEASVRMGLYLTKENEALRALDTRLTEELQGLHEKMMDANKLDVSAQGRLVEAKMALVSLVHTSSSDAGACYLLNVCTHGWSFN